MRRVRISREIEGQVFPDAKVVERPGLAPPVFIDRRGDDERGRRIAAGLPDEHEALRLRIGKRLEKERVQETEDRGGRAKADRQGRDDERCVARAIAEQPQRLPEVAGDRPDAASL